MYSSTFIFSKGEYDEEFYRLDETIAQAAKSIPGYIGEETWENQSNGLISNVYYWESLESLQNLIKHPAHQEAKKKHERWLNGYQVVIAEVIRTYGDSKLTGLGFSDRNANLSFDPGAPAPVNLSDGRTPIMSNPAQNDPLIEWNRLNVDNTEQAFASALYLSMSETTSAIDKFSLWLLAGTGATAALLIGQINSVLPFLTSRGFKACLGLLTVSALFGFVAKYKALRCEVQLHLQSRLESLLNPVFAKHGEDEEKIRQYALERGVELKTEICFAKVIAEFAKPLPWWAKLLMSRQVRKNEGDRQAGYRMAFKAYMGQIRWTFYQGCLFIAFMLSAAWYAHAI
jgi:heme-degrading monooxygenase HmoA